MDKIFEKFMSNNQVIAETIIFVSCTVLSGIALIFACDKKMFLELDLIKLILLALIPSFIIFSISFIGAVVLIPHKTERDMNKLNILFSSTVTAFYNLTFSYLIYEGVANEKHYIRALIVFVIIGIFMILREFVNDTLRK